MLDFYSRFLVLSLFFSFSLYLHSISTHATIVASWGVRYIDVSEKSLWQMIWNSNCYLLHTYIFYIVDTKQWQISQTQWAQNVCKQAVSQAIKSSSWLSCQMDVCRRGGQMGGGVPERTLQSAKLACCKKKKKKFRGGWYKLNTLELCCRDYAQQK